MKKYINDISFKLYYPSNTTRLFKFCSDIMAKVGYSLEVFNTVLPEGNAEMKKRLSRILGVPRMSTYAIGAIINRAVSEMPDNASFVNVGVWNGYTFLSGLLDNDKKKCIGVDNFSQFGGPKEQFFKRFETHKSTDHFFYDMDYVDYFSNVHDGKIGFYIYDGEHRFENQLRGLEQAEKYFSNNCLVLVDDTNWDEPRNATLKFIADSPNKYLLLADIVTTRKAHPTFWNGIMVFQRVG